MRLTPQISNLETMARALGELTKEVVVVGGAVVELLLTDPAAPIVRPTIDVDVIVEINSRVDYYRLEDRLRKLGFGQRLDEPVICRWFGHGIVLDVMPDDEAILGFSNPWYSSAIQASHSQELPSGVSIRVIDAPHFLGTKIEALRTRGGMDLLSSHDFEDVVILINGRAELVAEVIEAPETLRAFLKASLTTMRSDLRFKEGIEGALAAHQDAYQRGSVVQGRVDLLLQLLEP